MGELARMKEQLGHSQVSVENPREPEQKKKF